MALPDGYGVASCHAEELGLASAWYGPHEIGYSTQDSDCR
jgi:hypothetical protein